ncbi:MAG: hypothetical protein ACYDEX_07860, partial [Mobilitalea sp.]
MDDSTLEKKLSENYCNMRDRLQVSESCKNRLEHLTVYSKHSKVRTRIIMTQVICLLLLLILIPATAYAAVKVSDAFKEKVKEADLSNEQIEKLYNQLKECGFTDKEIEHFSALHRNEYGQIYGIDAFGAELIAATSVEGLDGYVYREDLNYEPDFKTPAEAIAWQESHTGGRTIPVYESD